MSLVKPETLPLTFIKPVVSTANVGQLAVDLIIASLALERIAIFGVCHRNGAEVIREESASGQDQAQAEAPSFLVILEFVAAAFRRIDNDIDKARLSS